MREKLVRDKIPEIVREAGLDPRVRQIHFKDEKLVVLHKKLIEDTTEVIEAGVFVERVKEECADLLEVIRAVTAHNEISVEEIEAIRAKKEAERGGFTLFYTIEVDDLAEHVAEVEEERSHQPLLVQGGEQ